MKVLSIDVGIKNLAYCLIDVAANANADAENADAENADANSSSFKIIQWDVLNLCGNDEHKCNVKSIVKKNKTQVERLCDKKASHMCKANTSYICSTHLKKLHPDLVSIKTVKKAKNSVLLEIANK